MKIGDEIIMPEPNQDDSWQVGGFVARIVDILDSGKLIVEDQDSDFWEVEPYRVFRGD